MTNTFANYYTHENKLEIINVPIFTWDKTGTDTGKADTLP